MVTLIFINPFARVESTDIGLAGTYDTKHLYSDNVVCGVLLATQEEYLMCTFENIWL